MIGRRTVLCLGLSQLICWGITYYLIGGLGELITAGLGWSRSIVYGGFSAALLVMGLSSPFTGRMIDRYGGRRVMTAGSCLSVIGCAGMALSHTVATYYAAWFCLGIAMRFTLYDAAFAALARIGGPSARRPMSQITLLGGLASTVFWPIGYFVASHFGWRPALFVYAGFALLTVPLHLAIPNGHYQDMASGEGTERSHPDVRHSDRIIAGSLYALIVTLTNFLNSGLSAHMISMLTGLGLAASVAVWSATLRGIGQSSARLCEVLFGARLHPLNLNLIATAVLPFCFIICLLSGQFVAAAVAFSFLYGAGNGIVTITRGTLPLVLFDHRTYGAFVGQLLVPSFLLSAVAPLIYAFVIERWGEMTAIYLSIAIAFVTLAAAAALKIRFGVSGRLHQE
jgi:predicted MFS family arabinose efflux permease